MQGQGRIGGQGPRRSGPDQEILVPTASDPATEETGWIGLLLVRIHQFVLAQAGSAPPAPGHGTVTAVQPFPGVAGLQKMPDMLDVVVVQGVVGGRMAVVVVPLHPVSHAYGLPRYPLRVLVHPGAARPGELGEAERLDVPFRIETKRPLHLDFHPQALTIEPVLPPLVESLHGFVAAVQVLVGPAPGVVDAHGVIRGDRTVDKGPGRAIRQLRTQFVENPMVLPPCEDALLHPGVFHLSIKGFEFHSSHLAFRDTVSTTRSMDHAMHDSSRCRKRPAAIKKGDPRRRSENRR